MLGRQAHIRAGVPVEGDVLSPVGPPGHERQRRSHVVDLDEVVGLGAGGGDDGFEELAERIVPDGPDKAGREPQPDHADGHVRRRAPGRLDERLCLGERDVLLAGTEVDQQLTEAQDVRHGGGSGVTAGRGSWRSSGAWTGCTG